MTLTEIDLTSVLASAPTDAFVAETHGQRACMRFTDAAPVLIPATGIEMAEGTIEIDLSLDGSRAFPGVAWRLAGDTYESFFVRPHQMGNPDAVQYTPVFNGLSAWQLYHDDGFWAPTRFPIGQWFTVRVAFSGDRGEAFVGDLATPALVFDRLRVPHASGGLGILPGGANVRVTRFTYDDAAPTLIGPEIPPKEIDPNVVQAWQVSNPVAEGTPPSAATGWQRLETEPSGLLNLSRAHQLVEPHNTVFVKTSITTTQPGVRELNLGFSDRAIVYLNGQPLFRGDDTYRSRDYRFLGSIGYHMSLFLPLTVGANELVVAVSESFGGWGIQARFTDMTGIAVGP